MSVSFPIQPPPFWQKPRGNGQMHAPLFQKLVRFPVQRLRNAHQTGQRKIVLAPFNAADECPVHFRAFGERFLRQGHFFSKSAHILGHTLAVLVIHARQVWKKKAPLNIDVNTIAFNTRQGSALWQNRAGKFLWNSFGRFQNVTGIISTEYRNMQQNFFRAMNPLSPLAGANGGITSSWQTTETINYIQFNRQLLKLIIGGILPSLSAKEFNGQKIKRNP